jgi:transcriptional regulator with XRE-family HTH domain
MTTATKARPKAKPLIGRNPITPKEIAKATKLAQRKAGVTRRQLAERLGITEARASTILSRVPGVKSEPLGAKAKKACRTLVFKAKKK